MQHFVHSVVTQDVFQWYIAFSDKTHQSPTLLSIFMATTNSLLEPVLNATVATDSLEGEWVSTASPWGSSSPALPHMFPMTVTHHPEHKAGGLRFALHGTKQMPYSNHCVKLLKKVLNSSMLVAAFSLVPWPCLSRATSSVKRGRPLEQPASSQTASCIIMGTRFLWIASSLCSLSLSQRFINEASTNTMNNNSNTS